jgi:septum formation protein
MLILASASPRRSELLNQIGIPFRVHPAHIPEDPLPGEDPTTYVARLARQKAETVYRELSAKIFDPIQLPLQVLGADTTVTLDNHILGKPNDPADAARMLTLLSGRTHQVLTGVALITANSSQVATESTSVTFSPITPDEIASYVATNEPLDKAGAYAIQGLAARWIPRIDGCYFNVVGLPLALVAKLLANLPTC